MTVDFTKYQEDITNAWRDVANSRDTEKWALYGYEGNNNIIKLMATGSKGLAELVQEFNCSLIQYAFCRIIDDSDGLNKTILINWQGDSAPLSRKGLCASHLGDVANYFKGCSQTIIIRNDDEATVEYLMDQIKKNSSSRLNITKQPIRENGNNRQNDVSKVGSSYSRPDVQSEIPSDRKSFWQRQEEEEKQRLIEEKKRAAEKQAQFERERKSKAESEAKKLAETIKERERIIDATRIAEKSVNSLNATASESHTSQVKDDDERVGRRSELIRLERNQETQSLISKGSIKNKRAIFEQASQQQQPERPPSGNLSRRSSGSMVMQRLNSLKMHQETSGNIPRTIDHSANIEKLTNGIEKNIILKEEPKSKSNVVNKEVECVKITNEESHDKNASKPITASPVPAFEQPPESTEKEIEENGIGNIEKDNAKVNGKKIDAEVEEIQISNHDSKLEEENNESNNNTQPQKAVPAQDAPKSESPVINKVPIVSQTKLQARALFDYQAGDNTEISFDPDDIIGYIEKVDPGWWHGSVITGKYKGMCGLFPSNYVQELQ